MAVNVDYLRDGLNDYLNSLTMHNRLLKQEFDDLSKCFAMIPNVYEGSAAEAFINSWTMTTKWFNEYIHKTNLLIHFLRQRIESLEQERNY